MLRRAGPKYVVPSAGCKAALQRQEADTKQPTGERLHGALPLVCNNIVHGRRDRVSQKVVTGVE
jgi:hypothetical protein